MKTAETGTCVHCGEPCTWEEFMGCYLHDDDRGGTVNHDAEIAPEKPRTCKRVSPCGWPCDRTIGHTGPCGGGVPRRYWT